MSKRSAAAKRGAATKAVQKEIAAKILVPVEDGIVIAGKKSYPRVKERVQALMGGKNMTEAEAQEAVHAAVAKEGYKLGQLIQYHDQGLRAGYLAGLPEGSQVWVQPIGPLGAKELPPRKHVKLENVISVIDGKFAPEEINDTMAKRKAAEAVTDSNAVPKSKAAKKTSAKAAQAAAVEGGVTKRGRAPVNSTIKLLKSPKEGELKGQSLEIVSILKEGGKSMSKADLIEAIGVRIPSKNVMGAKDIWAMNRKKLIDAGYLEEKAA